MRPERYFGYSLAQGISGGQQQVDHADGYAAGQEGHEETLHCPPQAPWISPERALGHLEDEQPDRYGAGDRGRDAEQRLEAGSPQLDRGRRAELAPEPGRGALRSIGERPGHRGEGTFCHGLGRTADAAAVTERVEQAGHATYLSVHPETSTVP